MKYLLFLVLIGSLPLGYTVYKHFSPVPVVQEEAPKPIPVTNKAGEEVAKTSTDGTMVVLSKGKTVADYKATQTIMPKKKLGVAETPKTEIPATITTPQPVPVVPVAPAVQPIAPVEQPQPPRPPQPNGQVVFTKVDDRVEVSFTGFFDTVAFTLDRPGHSPFAEWGDNANPGVGSYSMEAGQYPYRATFKKGTEVQYVSGIYTVE